MCLLLAELFEQTGQYEPLTTRIRNILREYKEGEGIFKELIQNADDAGASTVKFLVDWRNGPTRSLFSPGMAECQGPALLAYNNAVFSDDDFVNINKLAGETKVEDISKIGRFGLGFNAVYHLTDVPSFISREHLVIFDPNIHHLQRHIKDRSRPGIHINLAEKPESLTRYHDQFQPYNSVFGCNTVPTRGRFYYDGTLFRFPFRTAFQAGSSDISKTIYDRNKLKDIVSSLCECASTLLIFSQHIKEVEVYELDESSNPGEMQLVLSVRKPSVETFRRQGVSNEEPFIKQCSKWWANYRESQVCNDHPSCCELVNIVTTKEPSELSRCERRYRSNLMWFVVSASGTNASLQIARSPKGRARGYLPCGGAAFVIQRASEEGSWESHVTSDSSGELFCFLPLSIPTGLPVHVNGYFAIMSNRVEIWKRTNMRNQPIEVEWNEALMEDALARAYIMLLENMKGMIDDVKDYEFHTLWPSCDVDMQSWEKLVRKVCSVLLDYESKLFYSDGLWLNVNDGFLLTDDDFNDNEICEIVKVLRSQGIHFFNLPPNIRLTLRKFDQRNILQRRTLTFTIFVKQYFFPKIKTISPTQRDAIVGFGLDRIGRRSQSLLPVEESRLFKQNACISVSEDGNILAKPSQLIHPCCPAAELFSEADHRFPMGNCLRSPNRLHVLETLGMIKDLDWQGIYERAQLIANGGSSEKAEPSRKLIKYLNKQIEYLNKQKDKPPKSSHYRMLLQHVKFLPVKTKPSDEYLLPWAGSRFSSPCFQAPNDVFLPNDAELVGASCLIVDTSEESGCGKLNDEVKEVLGFSSRQPSEEFVIKQLDKALSLWTKPSDNENQKVIKRYAIESVCKAIYGFFNKEVVEKPRSLSFLNELGKRNWLFLEGKFVESKKVACTSNGNGVPFLFTLPVHYKTGYPHLFQAMQIKQMFDVKDYIDALRELETTKNGRALTEHELQLAIFFINQIDVENRIVKNYKGNIPLPDTERILRRSKDVVVNLTLWLMDTDDHPKVHEKIPPQTARALGARSLKSVVLKKCSHRIGYGESFGQQENLTDRLRGILDGYPEDGILKELVQNADDAEASQIHFIYDTRTLGSENVATDEASEEIQGPALCVYNDKPFTKEDLEGIKKLGIGSKRYSLGMTGKYGIGFNSVYHLTDCPSFLSNNDTLAFLDPHCRYFVDDDRGRLFKLTSMDDETKSRISDTLNGYYLGDRFDLRGSTMFRFSLRRKKNESQICSMSPNMEKLMQTFQKEACNSLLFLNHVKKITISMIHPNGKFEEIYHVETLITPQNEKKRQDMARKICELKHTETKKIRWEGASYTLTIKENKQEVEKWLIQQCIGSITAPLSTSNEKQSETPDGRNFGTIPRGGLAARLWTRSDSAKKKPPLKGIVYCFLPLPENTTGLPVHVNGHFALDNHRRSLWTDTDGEGERSKWNHFMNSRVLPPAYAALIMKAKNHICNDDHDNQLSRYHALFPKVLSDSPWKTLTTELYRYLGRTRAKVLPLLVPTESEGEPDEPLLVPTESEGGPDDGILQEVSTSNFSTLSDEYLGTVDTCENSRSVDISETVEKMDASENVEKMDTPENMGTVNTSEDAGTVDTSEISKPIHVTCTEWLSADQVYFKKSSLNDQFCHFLIRIGVPVLLHAPYLIYNSFITAGMNSHKVTPKSVIDFLRTLKRRSSSTIGNLPAKVETTAIKCASDLATLIQYCAKNDAFGENLAGLPLLLTQDGYLRNFNVRQPVFCCIFGDLFPADLHLFVHSDVVYKIKRIATRSKENIVHDFTVRDIARLLPHVFSDKVLKAIKDHATWRFPAKGILSESWLKEFWNLLQNYTKPEPNKDFVSLECLSEWPVIPTTRGKLVKVSDAKYVFDMTDIGIKFPVHQNVRTFLINLKCPVLNKEITFQDKHLSCVNDTIHSDEDESTTEKPEQSVFERKPAVTDNHVAHPHDVTGVLVVVNHMLATGRLDLTGIQEDEIYNFLRFVQDNYDGELLEEHRQIIMRLPIHKALNGQLVRLIGQFSSCSLIPSDVPMKQLDELQKRAKCLFLDSDVLSTLEKLYEALGVKAGQDVTQFYVEYVFKHFSLFTRESQMEHLVYIKDQVHPSLPKGSSTEKDTFLDRMTHTPCLPDEKGCLHKASEFFISENELFQIMFEDDRTKFPPPPFNQEDWLSLLEDIGLHVDITPQLFLEFCWTVAKNGARSPGNPQCRKQSRKLVKCLLAEKCLKEEAFLSEVSQIKFIAPAKVEEILTSIHGQYQCHKNGHPPYIKFNKAVPRHFRFKTWTTAPILPKWAESKLPSLRIAFYGPTYTNVLNHLENLVASGSLYSVDSEYLHKMIIKPVYQFLWKSMECPGSSPNNKCSKICADIGLHLKDVPCIFLQEEKIFVKGDRLVFHFPKNCDLKPFLYPVPRELGDLEHFLKRLGAAEKPRPPQIAYVLKCIHDKISEETISEQDTKVRYAMHVLFELLYNGESSDGIHELYLPSQEKKLAKSCEMVCKVPSCYTKWITNLKRPILLRFEECGLKHAADDYIDALPKSLRPTKFNDLYREDVALESKSSVCCDAKGGSICKFQEQYEKLLGSDEFQEGLKRLLVEDHQLPEKFEHKIRRLQTDVETKCTGMNSVKINIINQDTNEIMDKLEKCCYAVQDKDSWTLYIQHGVTDSKTLVLISNCINKILGDCINKESALIAMLSCSDPSEISEGLNELGIGEALSKAGAEFIPPEDDHFFEWDSSDKSKIGTGKGGYGRPSGSPGCHGGANPGGYRGGYHGGANSGGGYHGGANSGGGSR